MKRKQYYVYQSFETLGDSCGQYCKDLREAEDYAKLLRMDLEGYISEMRVPDYRDPTPVGYCEEIQAWNDALDACGLKYDEKGNTVDGPRCYGHEAGRIIAERGVKIVKLEE